MTVCEACWSEATWRQYMGDGRPLVVIYRELIEQNWCLRETETTAEVTSTVELSA